MSPEQFAQIQDMLGAAFAPLIGLWVILLIVLALTASFFIFWMLVVREVM